MKSEGGKRNWSNKVLYTICIIFFVLIGFIYVWSLNHQGERLDIGTGADNRIQVKITSKKSSKYHLSDANSQNNNLQEIEKLIEQTQSLSMDLIKQFDSDIQKADIKPDESRPYHRDYIYHGNSRQIETRICRNPYQLLVLCLDNTNTTRRNLYRQTWASEKERILTSDGMKALDWKIVFVVDVPNGLAERAAFKEEQLRHNDVIGFWSSSSRKETLKLMASMEWVDQNCEYTFLARMKSHMFLNTPKMFSLLSDPRIPSTELYAGHVVYDSNRTTTFHSAKKTLIKGYPRFIENAYLMSFDVVDSVIRKFHWSKPHPNPDVYIGELVLQSGIDVWPLSNFISFDVREICEMRLIQDGAIIQTHDQCMRMYSKESSRLIPEI